jgi:hypothetical protein
VSRTTTNRLLAALIGLIVIAAIAVGFYFIGKSAADASGAEQKGYDEGREEALANFEPGAGGYERIYHVGYREGREAGRRQGIRVGTRRGEREGQATGEAEGEKAGLEQGQQEGERQGQRTGEGEGASAALGNFASWDDGSFYIVRMGSGNNSEVPYQVESRLLMAPGDTYHICNSDPNEICQAVLNSGGQ